MLNLRHTYKLFYVFLVFFKMSFSKTCLCFRLIPLDQKNVLILINFYINLFEYGGMYLKYGISPHGRAVTVRRGTKSIIRRNTVR